MMDGGPQPVIGSYRIEERIGRGGMGEVFRGRHTKLPREVAIKSINPRASSQDLRHLRHRFEREAYIQSQLDHTGIVKIYDYVVAEQTYYIVMEYVEGRSLAELLAREPRPLPAERALYLFDQILTGLTYAHNFTYTDQEGRPHRGIIHRDLKPANLLVTPQDRVKITDFGIVKLVGADTTDISGVDYGSPRYVSPEQAQGLPVDQRSDIYSLGVILYEMLTGAPPFGNREDGLKRTEILRAHAERSPRPPSELNPSVTPEIEELILRALEKDPARRFGSAGDFLRAVRLARARDASDVIEEVQTAAESATFHPVGTHELDEATDATVRQSYMTQPMGGSACCASCGAQIEADEAECRRCGAPLGASASTARLSARIRPAAAGPVRGKLVVAGLVGLCLVTGTLVVARYTREAARRRESRAREEGQRNANAAPPPAASPAPPVPQSAVVELKPAGVSVDSSFDGYNAAPLTDGVTDVRRIGAMRYNEGNWASAESPETHWVELRFAAPERVTSVYVYWGFDRNRYVPPRRVELQAPDGQGGWRTVSSVEPGANFDRSAFEFQPLTTTSLRVTQPAQQGPQNRPFIMWLREVKVYGAKE